jgi:hypothetical protein
VRADVDRCETPFQIATFQKDLMEGTARIREISKEGDGALDEKIRRRSARDVGATMQVNKAIP